MKTHNPSTDTLLEITIKRLAIVQELAEALVYKLPVRGDSHTGHLDEIYISCHRPGVVRARICDPYGRVHHVDVEKVEVL